jgi:myo-inositol catabolism protein IolC
VVVEDKHVISEGFQRALDDDVPVNRDGIMIDGQFAAGIVRDAAVRKGYMTALSAEKRDSHEFEFEYGDEFSKNIEANQPTFATIQLRYNPKDDAALNQRQTMRLKQLSDYCRVVGQPFVFELLVPAMKAQGDWVRADERVYERRIRQHLAVEAVCVIQDANEVPTLKTAAAVPGFVGFAVERTTFWDAVTDFMEAGATRAEAVSGIRGWVAVSELGSDAVTVPLPHSSPRHSTNASLLPARVLSLPFHSERLDATATQPTRTHQLSRASAV